MSDEKELIFESIILNILILYHTKNFFQPPYLVENTNSVISLNVFCRIFLFCIFFFVKKFLLKKINFRSIIHAYCGESDKFMDGIRKYSKEWFTLQGKNSEEYRNAISNLENGKNSTYGGTSSQTINSSIFLGSKEEALEKYNAHKSSVKGMPTSTMKGVQKYGAENIFNALDADGDGVVTEQELKAVAALSTEEFASKDDETFSTKDLEILYENAMESVNASLIDNGLEKEFQYENGDVTKLRYDVKGNMTSKYVENANNDGTKSGITYYYETKTTSTKELDDQGRITNYTYNNPKDKTQNKETSTVYNDDGSKTVSTKTYLTTTTNVYDDKNKVVSQDKKYNYDINGEIEDTKQGSGMGDCWVLAGTNSLRTSSYGASMIKDAIKQNDDGSVTVTLKGVGKSYTYSPKEIIDNEYSTPSAKYSNGDTDMNLLERAIGDYRRELIESGDYKKNGRDLSKTAGKEATVADPLKGGQIDEAIYYITGQKSEFVYRDKDAISEMLETYGESSNKYVMNCSFQKQDYSVGSITTAHAYSIVGVDEDNVYVVNPWDSSQKITYPKEEFLANANQVSMTDLTPGLAETHITQGSGKVISENNNEKEPRTKVGKFIKSLFT